MNHYQKISLAIVLPFTSSISLIFASMAVAKILRSNRRLMTPSSRLLFGMCAGTIIGTFASLFSTIPTPKDNDNVWFSFGTTKTCELQGFLYLLGYALINTYSSALCIYYMFVVIYSRSDEQFGRRVEPFLHLYSISLPVICAFSALITESINPTDSMCWIAPKPQDCLFNDDVECVRGENAYLLRTISVLLPGILCLFIISYSLLRIFQKVRNQERAGERFRFSSPVARRRSPSHRSRAIQVQITCYLLGACFIFAASGIYRSIETVHRVPAPFAIILTARICHPLQGFINILIFIRPTAEQIRRRSVSCTWLRAFVIAFKDFDGHTEKDEVTRRRSSIRRSHTRLSAQRASQLLSLEYSSDVDAPSTPITTNTPTDNLSTTKAKASLSIEMQSKTLNSPKGEEDDEIFQTNLSSTNEKNTEKDSFDDLLNRCHKSFD